MLLLILTGIAPLVTADLTPGERLEYTFNYQGVFSGFIAINIARASLFVAPEMASIDGHRTYLTGLELSTEAFAKAEFIYPVRFRYRSWLQPMQQIPLLVQEYLQTHEVNEELLWFNWDKKLAYRYVKKPAQEASQARPPALLRDELGISPAEWSLAENSNGLALQDGSVWDYLSMLYHIRFKDLISDMPFELPVFNGKEIKIYRVEVTQERLTRAGWDLPAFKLDIYEMRHGRRKGNSVTLVWLSDDAQRRPLRFYVERRFGVVEGILETGRPLTAQGKQLPAATRKSLELIF